MKRILLAGAALAAMIATPAIAADMAVKAPPPVVAPVAVYNWTGCYVGGYGGGLWAHKDWTNVTPGIVDGPVGGHNVDGGLGGGQVGCDYQAYGNLVFGLQGNYGGVSAKGSNINLLAPGVLDETSINSLAGVTARIGVALDHTLLYAKGGGAWEHDSYDLKFAATGATLSTARETRGGYSIGGGVEYAITNCVSAFAEYDYYGFGTRTDTFFIPPAIGVTDLYSIKESKSVLEGGLNLRWGPSGCGWTPTPAAAPIVTKR